MNQIIEHEKISIENMIYEVRGKQVMLDRDLAKLYNVETRILIQKVKRNIERFPQEFSFQMSNEEFYNWRSHFVMSDSDKIGLRRPPYVFTEQGVAMLSAILKSDVAISTSIRIMNAFVNMKKYISNNIIEQKYINNIVLEDRERINLIEETLNKFKEKNNHLFFEGQIYDAYSLMIDIFNKSKKEIIVIDNYIDKNLLDILSKMDRKVIIITNKYNNDDYEKYKKQYNNISLITNNNFHDRFIIIDKNILYHCGASFKDLGKKCFEISKIEEKDMVDKLLKKINI